jgi:predicted dehydrogenase
MTYLTRRTFLQTTAAAAATCAFPAVTISGTKSSGRVLGSNDRIRHAVVGIHGQGNHHLRSFAAMKDDVEVVYLVDPDSSLFASRAKAVEERGGKAPRCVQDVRKALEDKNLDTISIATPNHWHSLIAIWACQAGKDVYVEKPLSHNVFEGRKLVEAAARYKRVVQHGTQQRTSTGRAREIAAVQSGKYGKLLVSKGYCCKPRWSIGTKDPEKPPQTLDFNLWLGPAAEQPFHRNLVHYNWHWFWETGNGDTGNQGVHEMDVARWAIKGATLPARVWSLGGRFGYKDQGQTPNTQLTVMEFGDVLLLFETRGLVGKHKGFGNKVMNEYYTSEGVIRQGRFYPSKGGKGEAVQGGTPDRIAPGGQFGSFVRAVRSRKTEDNNAPAEVGHYSSALCHLCNISYRLGTDVPFNKQTKSLGDNKQVVESFETIKANLRAVGVDLMETTYRLGRTLRLDAAKEQFSGDDQANALLRRTYRKPFVVPEKV